jgi:hypothetical protein
MITLIDSKVVFNEAEHTYTLNGKQLHGITGMLSRQLFPDKYNGVPDYVMARAAERGTIVHHDCENIDKGQEPTTVEGQNYAQLRSGYMVIANEYTVTDNEYFASNIDCVWYNGEVVLADIKTTSQLDEEYVSWQLSIYAYLFEQQNPHLRVGKLYAVWLRGDIAKLIEVQRKDDEAINKLLDCERNGEIYPMPTKEETQLLSTSAIDILIEAKQMAEHYKKCYEDIEKQLLAAMVAHNIKSWDAGLFKATYTPASESTTFDTKKFQEEHPEQYKEYLKKSKRKESLRITIR